jgi:glucan phosphoethanolaminetransferase (alkaline phosphatase superfamily)
VSAVVVTTTLDPGGPVVGDWVIWPLFLGCIAVLMATVLAFRDRRDELTRRLREARKMVVVVAVAAFVLAMQAVLTNRGNPERHGAAYYLRNHTELTRVSRAEYRYAERKEQRLFAGIALVFYLAAIIAHARPATGTGRARAPAAHGDAG